ncbi:hypothetical protein [Nonomuraea sp. NPDC050643]|uniref:hypothetical protein n=1 Tax=Nonomuraea sp. NPDC050643 TaxID=3155660 RepID=UPI0033CBFFA3
MLLQTGTGRIERSGNCRSSQIEHRYLVDLYGVLIRWFGDGPRNDAANAFRFTDCGRIDFDHRRRNPRRAT